MLYVMVGLPGAGKSTYVNTLKARGAEVVCPDNIRKELTGSEEDQSRNRDVFRIAHRRTKAMLYKGYDVIFDATNINIPSRKTLISIAHESGNKVEAVCINTTLQKCLMQNSQRQRKVPEDVIKSMAGRFVLPHLSEGFDKVLVFD